MRNTKSPTVGSELDELRKRSAELIAEVERINQRIAELSVSTQAPIPMPALTIADTWVEAKRGDDSGQPEQS